MNINHSESPVIFGYSDSRLYAVCWVA